MLKWLLERTGPGRILRESVEYLREENKGYRMRIAVLEREIDKMAEHIAIQNGMIGRAREILDRQRVLAAKGEF